MEEFSESGTREAAPPAPPRWKGIQSLDLVHQINERCIEVLCDVAAANAPDTTLSIIVENREIWVDLGMEARRVAAGLPFIIVNARFKNEKWWRRAAESGAEGSAAEKSSNGLPREASEHLMHETTMFAWQTARWDRTVAQMSLAMSSSVVDIIALLTPQRILGIAARESHAIRVRWGDDAQFWRDLLVAAKTADASRLADLHLHAKLLLCSELAQLRPDPPEGACRC